LLNFRGNSRCPASGASDLSSPRFRKRHESWIEAQEYVTKFCFTSIDRKKYIDEIKRCARDYKRDTAEKVIVLQHISREELRVLPYSSRFSEDYLEKLEAKIDRIKLRFSKIGGRNSMLTITLDPAKYVCLSDYKHARKQLSELIRRIYRKFKPRAYLCIPELHHSDKVYGQIHFHILFVGVGYIPLNWLKPQLKALELGNENIKEVRGSAIDAVNYFMKYLRKSLKELYKTNKSLKELFEQDKNEIFNNDEIPELLAVLWALDMRFFSCSRSCLESRVQGSLRIILQQYVYVGIYPAKLFDKIPAKITDPNLCWQILMSKPPP